ncbi:invasion associated locus B family protein [Xanthobacter sp. V4C-4]|uniref:invasion associated locus B family protein n=1 Tax=Xanthobacter cornucopiae TaxID=3119924 RepID=UPI003728190B
MHPRTLVLLATLLGAVSPAAAEGEKAPVYTATGWRLECTNGAKGVDCQVGQRVVVKDSGQLVAMVAARVPADTRKPVLVSQIPLGILVSQPVVLKVDGQNAVNLAVETCRPEGCFANAPLPDAFATATRTGKELNLSFKGVDGQTVNMNLPLEGFAAVYAKAK